MAAAFRIAIVGAGGIAQRNAAEAAASGAATIAGVFDLNVKVDPAIIGGITVKLGSRMVDSSLRTKLNSIKHAMKEAR